MSFTGFCTTASLFSSLGLYSVFWQILRILWSTWSRFFLLFSVSPGFFFFKSFGAVSNVPTSVGITVNLVFHRFFLFTGKIQQFINLFTFFYFQSVVHRKGKIHQMKSIFLLIITMSDLPSGIK